MIDPLSITFGVVGTVGVALSAVTKLKLFIDGIEGAPTAVKYISDDLKTLKDVLESSENTVQTTDSTNAHARAKVFRLLQEPLKNCKGAADLISQKLSPFVKPKGSSSKCKWKAVVWSYREKDFKDLQFLLLSYKSSLEIALSAASFENNEAGFSDLRTRMKKVQAQADIDKASVADSSWAGSTTVQTDYDFAVKRFLLDAESAAEDSSLISLRTSLDGSNEPSRSPNSGSGPSRAFPESPPRVSALLHGDQMTKTPSASLEEDPKNETDGISEADCGLERSGEPFKYDGKRVLADGHWMKRSPLRSGKSSTRELAEGDLSTKTILEKIAALETKLEVSRKMQNVLLSRRNRAGRGEMSELRASLASIDVQYGITSMLEEKTKYEEMLRSSTTDS